MRCLVRPPKDQATLRVDSPGGGGQTDSPSPHAVEYRPDAKQPPAVGRGLQVRRWDTTRQRSGYGPVGRTPRSSGGTSLAAGNPYGLALLRWCRERHMDGAKAIELEHQR